MILIYKEDYVLEKIQQSFPQKLDDGKIRQPIKLSFNHRAYPEHFIISIVILRTFSKALRHISRSFTSYLTQISHSSSCGLVQSLHWPSSYNYNNHINSSNPCSCIALCTCTSSMVLLTWYYLNLVLRHWGLEKPMRNYLDMHALQYSVCKIDEIQLGIPKPGNYHSVISQGTSRHRS